MANQKNPGELREAISNMVVRVHADCLGRGPTKARTYINDGVVTCLLEDTLTRAERTLLRSGREARVLEIRASLQETIRETLSEEMERLTGRRVAALLSGDHVNPDVTVQVFVLDGNRPLDGGEGSPTARHAGGGVRSSSSSCGRSRP